MHRSDSATGQARQGRPLDELIFRRDLDEVHILICFLSGRNDRSLQTLSPRDPDDPGKTMTASEIIEPITKMRYPPDGTSTVNSRNTASPRRSI
jgi:hypothetical protein